MTLLAATGMGFLLAVLWFDLMHDVQVHGPFPEGPPEASLASIAGYYRRVTTDARPMNRVVALAMLAALVALVAQLLGDEVPNGAAVVALALVAVPVGLAGLRTVPAAVRLGQRTDELDVQLRLARAIYRDHVLCLASVGTALGVQLAFAAP
jgi:hypothetical protein